MPIWKSTPTLAQLNEVQRKTLGQHVGIQITEIGADFLRGTLPVDERTKQPAGLLHGGASVALAETLGSVAATLCLEPGRQAVGLEINANHIRAARSGTVIGTARPVHIGSRTQVWSIEIVTEDGKIVCVSRLTLAIIDKGLLAQ
jgi:1,4-dihydroxy-2-naphthoyl-CoA hydrolase